MSVQLDSIRCLHLYAAQINLFTISCTSSFHGEKEEFGFRVEMHKGIDNWLCIESGMLYARHKVKYGDRGSNKKILQYCHCFDTPKQLGLISWSESKQRPNSFGTFWLSSILRVAVVTFVWKAKIVISLKDCTFWGSVVTRPAQLPPFKEHFLRILRTLLASQLPMILFKTCSSLVIPRNVD